MAEAIKVYEAKTHFSAVLAQVEKGAEFVVSRGNTPIARISPVTPPTTRRLGFLEFSVPDSFFEPLTDDDLSDWEGDGRS